MQRPTESTLNIKSRFRKFGLVGYQNHLIGQNDYLTLDVSQRKRQESLVENLSKLTSTCRKNTPS